MCLCIYQSILELVAEAAVAALAEHQLRFQGLGKNTTYNIIHGNHNT